MVEAKKSPNNWATCEFQDLLEYIQPTRYIVESTEYNDRYDTPVLTAGKSFIKGYTNETNGIFDNLPTIIFDDFTTASKFVNFPFKVKSSAMKILVPSSKLVNLRFIYYCMQVNKIRSDTHKRYWISVYAKKRLYIPPLSEQNRIIAKLEELFSGLDKGIESLKTAREQLKVYRQAVLKHAFEGKITAQWREENKGKLETADQLLARIQKENEACYQQQFEEWKDSVKAWEKTGKAGKKPAKPKKPSAPQIRDKEILSQLPNLPYGWYWLGVDDLCNVVRGGSPRPAGDPEYYDGNIPFLKVADLTRTHGTYLHSFTFTIKEAGLQKTRLVKPQTLMLSNSGATLGVPKICMFETTFNDGIAAFLGLGENELIYHYYFWESKTRELRAINQGAAQPNLNTDLIKEFSIPVCCRDEMQIVADQIEELLSMHQQLETEIEQNITKSEMLRQSILKKAFSGQLVKQNPSDEPASMLLERIKAEKANQAKPVKKKKRKTAA